MSIHFNASQTYFAFYAACTGKSVISINRKGEVYDLCEELYNQLEMVMSFHIVKCSGHSVVIKRGMIYHILCAMAHSYYIK